MQAIIAIARGAGLHPVVLREHHRACLDATRDADAVLHQALGGKKLKNLRRLRKRLSDHGEIRFDVASRPIEVARAIETFLDLEASGWKAARGTALKQNAGDATFIRRATVELAAKRQCEIVTLRAGKNAVAAGIVLRHLDRAYFFKIGVDPAYARYSVGVHLAMDLTQYLCNDPSIASADSTAPPGHRMIEPIWRGRLAIGDVLIPLYRNDPAVLAIRLALSVHDNVRSRLRQAVERFETAKTRPRISMACNGCRAPSASERLKSKTPEPRRGLRRGIYLARDLTDRASELRRGLRTRDRIFRREHKGRHPEIPFVAGFLCLVPKSARRPRR